MTPLPEGEGVSEPVDAAGVVGPQLLAGNGRQRGGELIQRLHPASIARGQRYDWPVASEQHAVFTEGRQHVRREPLMRGPSCTSASRNVRTISPSSIGAQATTPATSGACETAHCASSNAYPGVTSTWTYTTCSTASPRACSPNSAAPNG